MNKQHLSRNWYYTQCRVSASSITLFVSCRRGRHSFRNSKTFAYWTARHKLRFSTENHSKITPGAPDKCNTSKVVSSFLLFWNWKGGILLHLNTYICSINWNVVLEGCSVDSAISYLYDFRYLLDLTNCNKQKLPSHRSSWALIFGRMNPNKPDDYMACIY